MTEPATGHLICDGNQSRPLGRARAGAASQVPARAARRRTARHIRGGIKGRQRDVDEPASTGTRLIRNVRNSRMLLFGPGAPALLPTKVLPAGSVFWKAGRGKIDAVAAARGWPGGLPLRCRIDRRSAYRRRIGDINSYPVTASTQSLVPPTLVDQRVDARPDHTGVGHRAGKQTRMGPSKRRSTSSGARHGRRIQHLLQTPTAETLEFKAAQI